MAEEQQAAAQEPQEGAAQEPDYKALYEKAQADLDKAKESSRKWEGRSKANAEKAKAYDESQAKAKTVEERLAALEQENASLKAARDRADVVSRVAKATGLSESVVAMLNGTDEDALTQQAEGVKAAIGGTRRYPAVGDRGPATGSKPMTEDDFAKIKNPAERIRARAAAIHNSK